MSLTKHASRLALLASAGLAVTPLRAADYVVAAGTTDTSQKSVRGTDTLTIAAGGALSVDDTAVKWNNPSTDLRIINDGTIESTAADERAINAGGNATEPRTLTLVNSATGVIRAESDGIRINTDITGGTVRVSNAGTILSSVDGQAIDFDAVASAPDGAVEIDNLAGGTIRSTDADALRPGQGALVNNAGTIYAGKVDSLSADAVDLQGHSATVHNLAGGLISGARHGITTDTDVMVINDAGAAILGRNGSGVGSDGNGTVINHGTITGAYDGSGTGDGDGIDIDHVGYVENYGTIQALGAAGTHSDGRPNGSDGVTFGDGGTFINHAGALLYSVTTGAAFGVQATVINEGTIHAGGVGIGTDIGDDIVINSGTVISDGGLAISTGAGDDQLTLLPGSSITGLVDGGEGDDLLTLGGDGAGSFGGAVDFERLAVASGSWTLTGASDFASGTTIASGAALTGSGATLTGMIDDAGTLTVDQPADAAFAAALTGAGQLVKTGAGTLAIGDQAFTGATRVAAGTLLLGGTLPSAMTVGGGAALSGAGTIAALSVENGGSVRPAGGAIAVSGDLVQQAGSRYVASVATGAGASLTVGGMATLAPGALIALAPVTPAGAVGSRYVLLTAAGGITGAYTVEQDAQGSTELRLAASANEIDGIVTRTAASLAATAATANQAAVAGALGTGSAAYAALTLDPSDASVRNGLAQLAGELHASVRTAMTQGALLAEGAVLSRLDALPGGSGLWGQFVGGHGTDDGTGGAAKADRDMLGGLAGVDAALGLGVRAGLAAGYTRTRLAIDDRASRARVRTGHVLGYVGADTGPLRLRAAIGYSWDHVRTRRAIVFTGFSDSDRAGYHGDALHGFGEVGFAVPFGLGTIVPFARGTVVRVHTDGFSEAGGAAALDGAGRSDTRKFSNLGVRLSTPLAPTVGLRAGAAWQHAYGRIRSRATLAFAGGTDFAATGTSLSRDAVSPTLDIVWQPAPRISLAGGYAGQFGARGTQNVGRVTLSVGF